jgi:DNA-binding transcriptional LysR family regulator
MDRVASMASFVKVAETSGFSAAARKLNLSTSMVTTHIKALEDRLGVRLLNRSTRKVSLTDIGQAYYERCVQILADIDSADQIAEAQQSKPRGELRLNMASSMTSIIGPSIAEYVALYPDASVRLTVTSRMVDLVEDGYDLAIRLLPLPDSSLIVRRLASYCFVVCGAPDYFARRGVPQDPSELLDHNCMMFSDPSWENAWHFGYPDGDRAIPLTGNLHTNMSESLRVAAVHGQGLICVPTFLVADELRSGKLVPVLTKFLPAASSIDAIYPHRRYLSPKVRSFIDLVAHNFRDAKWSDPVGCTYQPPGDGNAMIGASNVEPFVQRRSG